MFCNVPRLWRIFVACSSWVKWVKCRKKQEKMRAAEHPAISKESTPHCGVKNTCGPKPSEATCIMEPRPYVAKPQSQVPEDV